MQRGGREKQRASRALPSPPYLVANGFGATPIQEHLLDAASAGHAKTLRSLQLGSGLPFPSRGRKMTMLSRPVLLQPAPWSCLKRTGKGAAKAHADWVSDKAVCIPVRALSQPNTLSSFPWRWKRSRPFYFQTVLETFHRRPSSQSDSPVSGMQCLPQTPFHPPLQMD